MKHASVAPPASRMALARALSLIALIVMGAALLWKLAQFLRGAAWAIGYPNGIDYGEGIVWQQMRAIIAGQGYGPIDGFPSIVFHYPPLYYVVTSWVAGLGGFDELAAGRAVSIVSTLVAVLLVGLIAGRLSGDGDRRIRLTCGAAAALIALSCFPVAMWAPLMRVDMIGCALSLGGLYLAMLSLTRPRLIHLASVAFVAAVFAKQTMIAAPAAVFIVLLAARPRLAVAGIASSLALGLVTLAALTIVTDGGFLRHVFLYNVNRFDLEKGLRFFLRLFRAHAIYIALAAYGIASCWRLLTPIRGVAPGLATLRERLGANPATVQLLFVLTYLLFASVMTMLIGKVGANVNYLVEWYLVVSIFTGLSLQQAARAAFRPHDAPAGSPNWLLVVLFPIVITVQALKLSDPSHDSAFETPREVAEFAQLSAMTRAASRPIVSDDMVLLIRNGKDVVWEPAIFAELASTGQYDERPFVQMVRNHAFAFFVTVGDRGSHLFDHRYNPAIAEAMDEAYPRKREMAGYVVHLPAE